MIRPLSSFTSEIPGHAFNPGVRREVAGGSGADESWIDEQKKRERRPGRVRTKDKGGGGGDKKTRGNRRRE